MSTALLLPVLLCFEPRALYLWTASDGENPATLELLIAQPSKGLNYLGAQDWSPDGSMIAVDVQALDDDGKGVEESPTIYLVDPETAAARPLCKGSGGSWSPDGSRIALQRWHVDRGKRLVARDRIGLYVADVEDGSMSHVARQFWPVWMPQSPTEVLVNWTGDYGPKKDFILVDIETARTHAVRAPEGGRAVFLPDAGGNGLVTVGRFEADGNRDTLCRMTVGLDGQERRYTLEPIWRMPRPYQYMHNPKIARNTGDLFVQVERLDELRGADDSRSVQQRLAHDTWRLPEGDASRAERIIVGYPGVNTREIAPSPDGRRLTLSSNLLSFTPPDGAFVFEEDLLPSEADNAAWDEVMRAAAKSSDGESD